MYEEDSYPHRLFRLVLVVGAVSAVVFGRATLEAAALAHQLRDRGVGGRRGEWDEVAR